MILDEPSTGVDPVNRLHFARMLHTIKRDRAVLLTTHDMTEAELGDRIGIMAEGSVRLERSQSELLSMHRSVLDIYM